MLMSLFKKLSVSVLCNVCFQELALTEPTSLLAFTAVAM